MQEEERRRISQELHDTISQNIKALLLAQKELLSVCKDETACAELEKIIQLEKHNQKEMRTIIQNLAVPALKNIPFKTVINDLCEQFKTQSGIDCSFFVAKDVTLDDFSAEQKHHVLRIIQEALQNAKSHAAPSQTSVVIRRVCAKTDESGMQDKIRIMIFDDGTGFDSEKASSSYSTGTMHFGMSGMEMRAKLLGGSLTVNSSPDAGTEVRIEIPLAK